jgi:hypothetical protein
MQLCDYISKHIPLPTIKHKAACESRLEHIYNDIADAFQNYSINNTFISQPQDDEDPPHNITTTAYVARRDTIPPPKVANPQDFLHIPAEMRLYMMRCRTPVQLYRNLTFDNGHTVDVHLWFPNKRYAQRDCKDVFRKIVQWFAFCTSATTVFPARPCSNKLTVYLYMVPQQKRLPKARDTVIDRPHVNGGFSYPCRIKSNVIYIFRQEEWFKVLIHETLHNSPIDFSNANYKDMASSIQKQLYPGVPIDSFALSETYVELWATILNVLIQVYQNTQILKFDANIAKKIFQLFAYEKYWSVIQCIKILKWQGIQYKDLLKGGVYKEGESDVFAYYILKSIVCVFLEDFIGTVSKVHPIQLFGKFILEHGKHAAYTKIIRTTEPYDKYFDDSLRMTVWG